MDSFFLAAVNGSLSLTVSRFAGCVTDLIYLICLFFATQAAWRKASLELSFQSRAKRKGSAIALRRGASSMRDQASADDSSVTFSPSDSYGQESLQKALADAHQANHSRLDVPSFTAPSVASPTNLFLKTVMAAKTASSSSGA